MKAESIDATLLKQNINTYLLDKADKWYTNQISRTTRVSFKNNSTGIVEWCKALESRFKYLLGKLLSLFENIRYTVTNTRRRKDPANYINAILLNSKKTGIVSTEAVQMLLAYKYIDAKLRRDLPLLIKTLTISALLDKLRNKKEV